MQNTPKEGFWARFSLVGTPPPWSNGDAGLSLAVLALSLTIIASTVTILLGGEIPTAQSILLGWIVGMVIAGAYVLIRWQRTPEQWSGLRWQKARLPDLLAFLIGVAIAFTADLVAAGGSGQFSVGASLVGLVSANIGEVILGAIFVILVQPFVEGVIFFGILQPRLRTNLGGYAGWLLTSLLYMTYYGLIYGARMGGSLNLWYGFIFPLLVALVIGAIRIQTQSTRSAIAGLIGIGFSALMVLLAIG